jgi:hypothetical protein
VGVMNTSQNLKTLRHELKFFINYCEYEILSRRLSNFLTIDKYADNNGNYHIRSLYFDNLNRSAIYEKQAGILTRKKFRIRIYNLNDSVIKLEKKSKIGQFIHKESAAINKDEYSLIMKGEYSFLRNSKNKLLIEFYFYLKSEVARPVVIVDYIREAYVSKIENIRVTFDKELRTGKNNFDIFSNKPTIDVMEKAEMILEIKYDHFLPDYIRDVLQIGSSKRYAISKYVICQKYSKLNNWEDN